MLFGKDYKVVLEFDAWRLDRTGNEGKATIPVEARGMSDDEIIEGAKRACREKLQDQGFIDVRFTSAVIE